LINIPFSIIVESEFDTDRIAKSFAEILLPGDIVILIGNLGCGKTFFVRSSCISFGITNVSSPSFAIVNEYEGSKIVYHFDFYRIKNVNELYDIGIDEYMKNAEAVIFIEWADLWKEVIPKNHYEIQIDFLDTNKRKISISKKNEK
jgi:tRNA threonylcarbamoyladenosine biosynthesis protein TsaE